MVMEQFYYTEREKGKGFDPSCIGFQVAACSPGIDSTLRAILSELATHYGRGVLWECGPGEAKDLERKLRLSDEENEPAPAVLTQAYPAIWSCYRLGDGRMALGRAGYRGFVKDGRPGNFFVHTLVFNPGALAAFDYNPLVLSRSGLFEDCDTPEKTLLETIVPEPPAAASPTDFAPLLSPAWSGRIASILTALLHTRTGGPSVIICLPGWLEAPSLIEAILALVPPHCRGRISFCTNENQPRWKPANDTTKSEAAKAGHDLLVFCGPEGGVRKLQQDDYIQTFSVFNFVEQKFSNTGPPCDYARFAADCVLSRKENLLHQHHDLAEGLGCGADPSAWDVLVTAMPLMDPAPNGDSLAAGLEAVLGLGVLSDSVSGVEARAIIVRDMVWPHLRRLAGSGDNRLLTRLAGLLGRLFSLLGDKEGQVFADEILELAVTTLLEGRVMLAVALLAPTGQRRDDLCRKLHHAVATDARLEKLTVSCPGEGEALIAMIAEALIGGQKEPFTAPETERLLEAAFRNGRATGTVLQAWTRLGQSVVLPFFQGALDDERLAFLRRFLSFLPTEICLEGYGQIAVDRKSVV